MVALESLPIRAQHSLYMSSFFDKFYIMVVLESVPIPAQHPIHVNISTKFYIMVVLESINAGKYINYIHVTCILIKRFALWLLYCKFSCVAIIAINISHTPVI